MDPFIKKIIAGLGAFLIVLTLYYGSYLPLRKSGQYIETLHSLSSIRSVDEFQKSFSESLDVPSPIGQEELVRNMANVVIGIVSSNGTQHPEIIEPMLSYLHSYFDPILRRGRGMSFEQNLFLMGSLYQIAYDQTREQKYIDTAIRYFEQGRELGPKRPQFLYGLFSLYQRTNQAEKAKAIGEQIIAQWPADAQIRAELEKLSQMR